MIGHSIIPTIIYSGAKINYMHIERGLNIRIIDSLNFLPTKLKNLPKAFGLDGEIKKGEFPHFFNTPANQDYIGPYPHPQYYGVKYMNADDREEFLSWHAQKSDSVFDFQKEMFEYCQCDVSILRKSCLKFRKMMLEQTGEKILKEDSNTGLSNLL